MNPYRFLFTLSLACCLALSLAAPIDAKVLQIRSDNPDGVPLHPAFSDNNLSGRIPNDTKVYVVGGRDNWLEIKHPEYTGDETAWIVTRYVVQPDSEEVASDGEAALFVNNATFTLPPDTAPGNLRIGTWNIRNFIFDERPPDHEGGFLRRANVDDITTVLAGLDFDMLALQEIRDEQTFGRMINEVNARTGRSYEFFLSNQGGAHRQKVGFVWDADKLKTAYTVELESLDISGGLRPGVLAHFQSVEEGGADFTALVVHLKSAPWGYEDRRTQMQTIVNLFRENPAYGDEQDLIFLGDFNTTGKEGETETEKHRNMLDEIALTAKELTALDMKQLVNEAGCTEYWDGRGELQNDGIQIPSHLDLVFYRSLEELDSSIPLEPWLHCKRANCEDLVSSKDHPDATFWDVSDHCPLLFEIENKDRD